MEDQGMNLMWGERKVLFRLNVSSAAWYSDDFGSRIELAIRGDRWRVQYEDLWLFTDCAAQGALNELYRNMQNDVPKTKRDLDLGQHKVKDDTMTSPARPRARATMSRPKVPLETATTCGTSRNSLRRRSSSWTNGP